MKCKNKLSLYAFEYLPTIFIKENPPLMFKFLLSKINI